MRGLAIRVTSRIDAFGSISNRFPKIPLAAATGNCSASHVHSETSRSLPPSVLRHNNIHPCFPTTPARFVSAASTTPPDIKLYQYLICPFCNITKSLLSYSALDYKSVEVNPLTKAELKQWSGEYKKVPIAIINGHQVNGSEHILESILNLSHVKQTLEERWADENGCEPMTMQQFQKSENALLWTRFAADHLAALLYPNICGSLSDSYDAFGYVKSVDSFSALQKISIQYLGALAMYFAASKVKCKLLLSVC